MKSLFAILTSTALFATGTTSLCSAELEEGKLISLPPELQIESSTAQIIGAVSSWNKALQDQQAIVRREQEHLDGFPENAKSHQDYIEAKRDLETSLALLRIIADSSIKKIAVLNRPSSGMELQQAVLDQYARVLENQKRLSSFDERSKEQKDYINAKRELETSMALMRAMSDKLEESWTSKNPESQPPEAEKD